MSFHGVMIFVVVSLYRVGVVAALSFVLLHLVVLIFQLDAHGAEHLFGLGAVVVAAFAHHALDAAVDDEHGAGAAGGHAAV